jgi:hypothetical protein
LFGERFHLRASEYRFHRRQQQRKHQTTGVKALTVGDIADFVEAAVDFDDLPLLARAEIFRRLTDRGRRPVVPGAAESDLAMIAGVGCWRARRMDDADVRGKS